MDDVTRFFHRPSVRKVDDILLRCSSNERADTFMFLFGRIDDGSLFWRVLAKWWSGFDAIDQVAISKMMRQRKSVWTPECMTAKDRNGYGSLPKRFEIYRGQDAIEPVKNSWTVGIKVAEGFARGHRGITNPNPRILTAMTTKTNVALYQSDRRESEVVLFRRPTLNYKATRRL